MATRWTTTRPPAGTLTSSLRHWLTERGSLTARLQAYGCFSVRLLSQRLAIPLPDEADQCRLPPQRLAWLREVVLYCDGVPFVYARSVLPRCPRGPLTRAFRQLGKRSLGALLFAHPACRRGNLELRRLDERTATLSRAIHAIDCGEREYTALWARRSRFSFSGQKILVTEVFSPAIQQLTESHLRVLPRRRIGQNRRHAVDAIHEMM